MYLCAILNYYLHRNLIWIRGQQVGLIMIPIDFGH